MLAGLSLLSAICHVSSAPGLTALCSLCTGFTYKIQVRGKSRGWQEGSLGKALVVRACGLEFDSQASTKKAGCDGQMVTGEPWGLLARLAS